jgi:hypothetical protein
MLRRLLEYYISYRVKTVSSIEYIVSSQERKRKIQENLDVGADLVSAHNK